MDAHYYLCLCLMNLIWGLICATYGLSKAIVVISSSASTSSPENEHRNGAKEVEMALRHVLAAAPLLGAALPAQYPIWQTVSLHVPVSMCDPGFEPYCCGMLESVPGEDIKCVDGRWSHATHVRRADAEASNRSWPGLAPGVVRDG